MDIKNFRFKISVTVRFNEVDMLGVCNNAVYINYFELARLQYIKELGLIPSGGLFSDGNLFFIVRNEINYFDFARYDDELNIYTRISFVKNSSFGFDHLIENAKTKKVIADGKGVIVQVDPKTKKSLMLTENFLNKVREYEQDIKFLKTD
jgi:acyl-CoA thioester hydrolase